MGRELTGEVLRSGPTFRHRSRPLQRDRDPSPARRRPDGLRRHGVADDDVDVAWVPGSFEIPLVARRLAETGRYAAVICLGAVIRGETDHYAHVAGAVTSGVARVGLDTGVPAIFGILTTDTVEQALNRAGLKAGNIGYDAAIAAIEMANLVKKIDDAR